MKLYYDNTKNELVEGGNYELSVFTRDSFGNIGTHKTLDNLTLIGEIYDEPIHLPKNLRLSKIMNGEYCTIIEGFNRDSQIREGFRFNINAHNGFNYYSTNLVTGMEWVGMNRIDFYTLSGSHYMLELI